MSSNPSPSNGQAPPDHTRNDPIGDTEDEWDTHSVTKGYYRMTVKRAWEYVEDLRKNNSKKQLEKLEDDELSIMKNRARLSKNKSTVKLQEDLKVCFKEWCDEVNSRDKSKNFGHLCVEQKRLVKPSICSVRGKVAANGGDNEDPAHDMKAYFIFFEKDGEYWKGRTHSGPGFPKYEKFPDQRISVHDALNDDNHNPFEPPRDGNGQPQLQYIHIPANHMGASKDIFANMGLTFTNNILIRHSG